MDEHSKAEMLACVDREVKYRRRVYERWVSMGKLSAKKATYEIAAMASVRAAIEQHVPDDPPAPQKDLFG